MPVGTDEPLGLDRTARLEDSAMSVIEVEHGIDDLPGPGCG
jgi:hypothetical protein